MAQKQVPHLPTLPSHLLNTLPRILKCLQKYQSFYPLTPDRFQNFAAHCRIVGEKMKQEVKEYEAKVKEEKSKRQAAWQEEEERTNCVSLLEKVDQFKDDQNHGEWGEKMQSLRLNNTQLGKVCRQTQLINSSTDRIHIEVVTNFKSSWGLPGYSFLGSCYFSGLLYFFGNKLFTNKKMLLVKVERASVSSIKDSEDNISVSCLYILQQYEQNRMIFIYTISNKFLVSPIPILSILHPYLPPNVDTMSHDAFKQDDQLVVLIFFSALPFLAFTPATMVAIRARRSLVSFNFVMVTLEGWIGIWQGAPLALFLVTFSIWITHFLRNTWITFPLKPLLAPRLTRTSSSFLMGSERTPHLFLRPYQRLEDMIR